MPINYLWTSTDAQRATGGKATCAWQADSVSIDSRKIAAGDLFIAIPGERFDGHDFVAQALENGAAAAVVTHIPAGVSKNAPLLVVENIITALQDLARFSRRRMQGKIIAVTGSVGKTSTKEMLAVAFKGQGRVYCTEGNLNNHFGLPLSLARMPADTDFGIFEIGMNHPGEIKPLTKLARPDIAIITTVEAVHLEFFNSVTEIAHAKAEIFAGMEKNSTAILNFDNQYYKLLHKLAEAAGIENIRSFGTQEGANFSIKTYAEKSGKALINIDIDGTELAYALGVAGRHQAVNSAAVLAAVQAAGGELAQAAANLAGLEAKAGRGKIITINYQGKELTVIDDCYNASPASVAAALDNLGGIPTKGRKIAVLGDMFELGEDAPALHRDLNSKLLDNKINSLFVAGELMLGLYNAVPEKMRGGQAKDSAALGAVLAGSLQSGDVILLKGSRGMKMENILNYLLGK